MGITTTLVSAHYDPSRLTSDVVVLPVAHLQKDLTIYHSSAPSLLKHLQRSGITSDYIDEPESLYEQRSNDWFGPSLMIFHSVYTSNPDIFKLLLEALTSHLKNLYPSDPTPNLRVQIRLHKDDNSQTTDVQFEGDPTHFPALLKTLEKTWKEK